MNSRFLLPIVYLTLIAHGWAACSSCGLNSGDSPGVASGPYFNISLGTAAKGHPAGELYFGSSAPNPGLYTPELLTYSGASLPDVVPVYQTVTSATTSSCVTTNVVFITTTNYYDPDGLGLDEVTNFVYTAVICPVTNVVNTYATNVVIRQIYAPQALADVPTPPTANGYAINFYYPSQVGAPGAGGIYAVSGSPYATWIITNTDTSSDLNLLVYETTPADGLLKQWIYNYSTNSGTWMMTSLGGVQNNLTLTNLDAKTYAVINTVQYSNAPVVQETRTVYQTFSWGVAPIEMDLGAGATIKTTTYTYYDPSLVNNMALKKTVVNPDGSWQFFAQYDDLGNPLVVYSSFGDAVVGDTSNGRETDYTYNPAAAGIPSSVDNGTLQSYTARLIVQKIQGQEVSRQYTVFPAPNERLEITCTVPGANWNAVGNLVATNMFFSSGPNQFALQSVVRPDGTMTIYSYVTNNGFATNVVVSGQADPTYNYIVDGVSNILVLNASGNKVVDATWDVKSTVLTAFDVYGNYDNFGRPQQVTHLDGTVETKTYACCGLESTTDRDGVGTVFLYDLDKRPYGYEKYYSASGNPITYQNTLDAAGRTVQVARIGTDNSVVVQKQYGYDLADRRIVETNALNGPTSIVESTDPTTGGLIRTTTYPNGGTRVDSYYLDGSIKSVEGTGVRGVRYVYGYGNDVNQNCCTFTKEIKLKSDGTDSSEWAQTFIDMAGRTTEILYPDGAYGQSLYNRQGQLSERIDPDSVTNFYAYNARGELAYTATAMSPNESGINIVSDRIKQTTNDVTSDHGVNVRRSRTLVWLDGSSIGTLASVVETSVEGLTNWQTQYSDSATAVTSTNVTSYGPGSRTVISSAPDGSYTINLYSYNRLISSTRYDSTGAVIGGTGYSYDAHGRQYQVTDARNGVTTYGYNAEDQVASVTTPAPGSGQASETTTTLYNSMLQPYSVSQPDFTTVTTAYWLTGEIASQSGSRTYPVAYGYDYAGRMQTMTNWSGFSSLSGARVTTWNYDSQRGWLNSKAYADGNGPAYTYTPAGRLASRVWARGITTRYAYDMAGDLTGVSYSDGVTPNAVYAYDRLGRQNTAAWSGITDTMSYNLANQLLSESFSAGPLAGLSVTNGYDQFLRRTNLTALSSTLLSRTVYGYDAASRLSTVNDGNNDTATYSYVANSPLVGQITFKQNGTTEMTTSKQYDDLNRLTQITSQPGGAGAAPVSFNYSYNPANQRTQDKLADGSYWVYQYDALGQVTSGHKYFYNQTPVPGQQFDYAFDTIGNRQQSKAGGDQNGGNQRVVNYTNNVLNQLASRGVTGTNDVIGVALATNAVTVNGLAAFHKWEYFWEPVGTNNGSSAAWEQVTAVSGGSTTAGGLYVAQNPEQFSYDADGNLLTDGRWNYTWDAENRLAGMTVNKNAGPQYQITFAYDAKGRRMQKTVVNGSSTTVSNFLYDGWNLVAVLNPQAAIVQSFVWGSDLSSSMQGAGGVGGLLEVSYRGAATTNCFVAFDGNGNVAALVNAANGTAVATYEYGPFGEVIRATGPMAKANPIRFSTKYQDDESDLLYYGYRYYKPSTGSWVNRDPIGEVGFILVKDGLQAFGKDKFKLLAQSRGQNISGLDLYVFTHNTPLNSYDYLGLAWNNGTLSDSQWNKVQNAIKNFSDKAKKCAAGCPKLSDAALKAVTALSDPSSNIQIGLASQSHEGCAPDNCGYNPVLGDSIIVLCPNAFDSDKCDGLQCTLFHEALHAVGSIEHGGSGNANGNAAFNSFEKCMGCSNTDYK